MTVTATPVFVALVLFQCKHLLADFVLQTGRMVKEKGHYGRPGGLQHTAIHVLASAPIVVWLVSGINAIMGILVAEFVLHYHIDWYKEKIGRRLQLAPTNKRFWVALGVDQLLHQLTYIGMPWWLLA